METSTTGKQAVEILQNDPEIGLLLMDMMMPDMDGYAALKMIRQTPTIQNIPVIALTAQAIVFWLGEERDDRYTLAAFLPVYCGKYDLNLY